MLFTDRFVYLHLPKTGGTFVTQILVALHSSDQGLWARLQNLPRWRARHFNGPLGMLIWHPNKHGIRSEIPIEHQAKLVLGTVRNPFDRLVSAYEFGWW